MERILEIGELLKKYEADAALIQKLESLDFEYNIYKELWTGIVDGINFAIRYYKKLDQNGNFLMIHGYKDYNDDDDLFIFSDMETLPRFEIKEASLQKIKNQLITTIENY